MLSRCVQTCKGRWQEGTRIDDMWCRDPERPGAGALVPRSGPQHTQPTCTTLPRLASDQPSSTKSGRSNSKPPCIAQALERSESRTQATEALRVLIDAIVLTPDEGALRIELRGNLAPCCRPPRMRRGHRKAVTSCCKFK
jgi:hypothetical protein